MVKGRMRMYKGRERKWKRIGMNYEGKRKERNGER